MELKTVLQMHTDDAYDHLVKALTKVLEVRAGHPVPHNQRPYGCDIWIPNVAWEYWRTRVAANVTDVAALPDEHFRPFYDAAWELCRVGVMRPGNVIARGQAMGT